ncbi:MAG: hypothetical protein LBD69_04215 [Puniceicoccales bacterium]|jgi:hypothetical protein|nr:hypothetical protein [Puniceicoccales bacterium]
MKKLFCLLPFLFSAYALGEPVVQFTKYVKDILTHNAAQDVSHYDITIREDRIAIRKLFKKDSLEKAPIYAKILLDHESHMLESCRQKLLIMELLKRFQVLYLIYHKEFGVTCEEARKAEQSFRETMKLVDPLYH